MGVKNIAKLGKMIAQFLANFAPCFVRIQGRSLLSTYVQGLLSDVQRKNVEAILSQLFCAKVRQKLSPSEDVLTGELLTLEQVRRAANVYVSSIGLPPRRCSELYQAEVDRQAYYARRNAAAAKSHRKTRRKRLGKLGIDADQIKSVASKPAK